MRSIAPLGRQNLVRTEGQGKDVTHIDGRQEAVREGTADGTRAEELEIAVWSRNESVNQSAAGTRFERWGDSGEGMRQTLDQ